MSKKTNKHTLFLSSGCLNRDAFILLHENRLRPDQLEKVKKHIDECEFCKDALEGYQASKAFPMAAELEKIDIQIDDLLEKKQTKKLVSMYPYLAIAASIALLIGLYFIISPQSPFDKAYKSFSDNQLIPFPESSSNRPSPAFYIHANETVTESIELENVNGDFIPVVIAENESLNEEAVMEEFVVEEDMAMTGAALAKEKAEVNYTASPLEDSLVAFYDASGAISTNQQNLDFTTESEEEVVASRSAGKVTTTVTTEDIKASEVTLASVEVSNKRPKASKKGNRKYKAQTSQKGEKHQDGIKLYEKKKYDKASEAFEKQIARGEADVKSLYYCGRSYEEQNLNTEALGCYEKVIAFRNGPYYEDALYRKAIILINLDRANEARSILKDLVKSENQDIRQKAEKTLIEIK